MTVYLDGVIGLNFLIDWLLLLGVNRMAGFPPGVGRTAVAAAVGGGYAGVCLLPGWGFLSGMLWRGLSLAAISFAAFGTGRSGFRRGVLFVFLSMALGGMVFGAGDWSAWRVPGCTVCLGLLCKMGFRNGVGIRRFLPVIIRHNGMSITLNALEDTGNTLQDPLTGEPILVVDAKTAFRLLDLRQGMSLDPIQLLETCPGKGIRLIPYQTVGTQGKFLAGMRCEEVYVGKRRTGGMVAFSPVRLGNGEYSALTGGY